MGARAAIGAQDAPADLPDGIANAMREFRFSTRDFGRVQKMIRARAGISLSDSKFNMVYSRLSRRLRATKFDAFDAYLDRIEGDARFCAVELPEFVNALTTNLTSFFREPHHFPILAEFLAQRRGQTGVKLWCAAASTGEEPYTIAMTMIESLGSETDARLLATDIDTKVLAQAQSGVFSAEAAQVCGQARLQKFFLRGKEANEGKVRVRPGLARLVNFAPLNLLEDRWPALEKFAGELDALFCRNVMIYFDRPTQHALLARFAQALAPGGLLFVGHSENFTDCRDWFFLRGKTVYEKVKR